MSSRQGSGDARVPEGSLKLCGLCRGCRAEPAAHYLLRLPALWAVPPVCPGRLGPYVSCGALGWIYPIDEVDAVLEASRDEVPLDQLVVHRGHQFSAGDQFGFGDQPGNAGWLCGRGRGRSHVDAGADSFSFTGDLDFAVDDGGGRQPEFELVAYPVRDVVFVLRSAALSGEVPEVAALPQMGELVLQLVKLADDDL